MNTPHKRDKIQQAWLKRYNSKRENQAHDKPLCYNVCVPCGGRYISVDCYKRLAEAEKCKAKMEELNPEGNYVIIGNYRG